MKAVVPFVHRMNDGEETLWIEQLNAHWSGCEVRPLSQLSEDEKTNAEVAIVANPDSAELRQLPNLKWLQSLWAGVESLTQFSADTGIPVVRMEDPKLASTMAEAVLTWTLFLNRDMHRYARQQQDKVWQPFDYKPASDCTVGILGLGKLGLASARALNAHGFKTIGWSYSQKQIDFMSTFQGRDGLTTVVSQSDIVVVLLPLTAQTKGLINSEIFSAMKPGSCLINFARGPIVEVEPLLNFLEKHPGSHAVLDVFDQEPLPAQSPLWQHPSVSVLPHVTAPTLPKSASKITIDHIQKYFESGEVPKSIDRVKGY